MYRDDRIRSEMAVQRLHDEAMAERTGLARQTIALYRRGEVREPKLSSLKSIASALGKDLFWLVEPKPAPAESAQTTTA